MFSETTDCAQGLLQCAQPRTPIAARGVARASLDGKLENPAVDLTGKVRVSAKAA
jgi:hypothetical protein